MPIVVPRPCPECLGPLLLIAVAPAKPASAFERLYQCHECAHIEKVITSRQWQGWLNVELPPPHRRSA